MSHFIDKAEGNKFAKDFEDSSLKLQEFVSFLDKELKSASPLVEALGNADIFYEMQYKEVKIVANVSVQVVRVLNLTEWVNKMVKWKVAVRVYLLPRFH